MGYRSTREELISSMQLLNDEVCADFYKLSHEEKANPNTFESFCKKRYGIWALILSDDLICDNKELVLIAAKYGGLWGHLEMISERLLDDSDIALACADCNRYEFTKISKRLRDNPKLMLKALRINHSIYCSLPVKVKIDRDILLEIAENDPTQFMHIRDIRKKYRNEIFSDKELALIVANTGPYALEYFSDEVLNDQDVLQIAFCLDNPTDMKKRLLEYTWGFKYINPKYWIDDRELLENALKIDGSIYFSLPDEHREDKKLALMAIRNCPNALKYCPLTLRDDEDVVKAALQEEADYILEFASERLKDNYDIVLRAVKANPLNLAHASERLRDNREIVLQAVKGYGGMLEDASERLQRDDELIRIAEKNL